MYKEYSANSAILRIIISGDGDSDNFHNLGNLFHLDTAECPRRLNYMYLP
jgi:hypothetical protein